MPTEATTTATDVRRYVETDLTDAEITDYINDAEDEALTYNAVEDFRDGELDRLVKFYAAYLIAQPKEAGGDPVQLTRGEKTVQLSTPGEDDVAWLRERVAANDPSGSIFGGRRTDRHITFSGSDTE